MNKFAKGSLAAGAGVVLLLGGAGTLAYWNSADEFSGGNINSGELNLTAVDKQDPWEPEITTWVPGDQSAYSTTLVLTADGDNLQGTIELDEDSIVFAGAEGTTEELSKAFDIDFVGGGQLPEGVTYNEVDEHLDFETVEGVTTYEIPVAVTVAMPFGNAEDAADNASQGVTVDMSGVSFVAEQTAVTGEDAGSEE